MSNELTRRDLVDAFASVDAAYNAASTAQDQAAKLREHVDWLEEQVLDRDERIEQLQRELDEANERIEQLESEA